MESSTLLLRHLRIIYYEIVILLFLANMLRLSFKRSTLISRVHKYHMLSLVLIKKLFEWSSWMSINRYIHKYTASFNKKVYFGNVIKHKWNLNSFSTNIPFLHPLKTSENLRFSDVFRGYRSGTLVESRLS